MHFTSWQAQTIKLGFTFTGAIKLGILTPFLSKAIKKTVKII